MKYKTEEKGNNNKTTLQNTKKADKINIYQLTILYGADDGNRTHEMPEPQSGALTTSPHPPCSTACISIYKKKYFVKIKIKKYFI